MGAWDDIEERQYFWGSDNIADTIELLAHRVECKIQENNMPEIRDVIFNEPATIVLWKDGTKTVVKCGKRDNYDKEKGLAMCIVKKINGNKGNFNNLFKKWVK